MKWRLREQLTRNGISLQEFSELIGIKYVTLSLKLNNKSDFTRQEIKRIISVLGLSADEVMSIFFS